MTEFESSQLETKVIKSLQQLLAKYESLDELTQLMLAKQEKGHSIETEIDRMHHQRQQLTRLETEAQPINEAYRNSREHASETVSELTRQTTTLIKQVIARIAKLEAAARASYQQLIPEIDRNVRGNQMKQAYGNASS